MPFSNKSINNQRFHNKKPLIVFRQGYWRVSPMPKLNNYVNGPAMVWHSAHKFAGILNAKIQQAKFYKHEIGKALSTKQKQIAACKRALSIAARFKPSQYRGKHMSRIFKNLNTKRSELALIKKELAK